MSVAQLLAQLGEAGIALVADGERLHFAAASGEFTPALRDAVRARRDAVLAALGGGAGRALAGRLPLSFAQRSLWYLDRLTPGHPAYLMTGRFRLRGAFDAARFARALRGLAARHPFCRAAVLEQAGQPVLTIAAAVDVPFDRVDVAGLAPDEAGARARQALEHAVTQPFDLARAPLLRAVAVHRAPDDWWLAFAIHHLIADEWSIGILMRELSALYADGDARALPPPTSAEALLQVARAAGDAQREADLDHWRRTLAAPLPVLDLPTRGPRPARQQIAGARVRRKLPARLAGAIDALARRHGATPFMVYASAFLVVLARQAEQDEIVLGTVVAGRDQPGLDTLVGCFVNTLALRCDLSGDPTFGALLERVRGVAQAAYAHGATPFERVVEALAPERDPARPPLCQAAIVLENAPAGALALPGVDLESIDTDPVAAKFDLTLVIAARPDGLYAMLDYTVALFSEDAMQRLLGQLTTLLDAALAAPDTRCARLPLLADDETARLAAFEAGPPAPARAPCRLDALFAAQARRTPDRIALSMAGAALDYRALERWVEQVAAQWTARGIGAGAIVGLCVERSFEMVVAVLAVLRTGAAYLPLDPTYPPERLRAMTTQTRLAALLTRADAALPVGLRDALGDAPCITVPPREAVLAATAAVSVSSASSAVAAAVAASAAPNVSNASNVSAASGGADPLACVLYTSGSTAQPKGVRIGHLGLCNLALAQIDAFGIHADSRVLQFASLNFDASTSELFSALLSGATLCLAEAGRLLDDLGGVLRDERISVATLPPAVLRLLDPQPLPALATLVVAGDACPLDLARHWARGRRFLNAYGPTEASVCATIGAFTPAQDSLTIGRPMAGMAVRILDAQGARAPIGVAGDLYIGGVGVSHGYSGAPALTAERFAPDRHAHEAGARCYASGDRARWREDGRLDFLGRRDRQVKLRGMRVEPAEIEAALVSHPAVAAAVVVARADESGERYLAAYVTPRADAGAPLDETALRRWLRERLPPHLVPGAIVALAALPLGPNGKVEHRALPAPDLTRAAARAAVAPRDDTEARLFALWRGMLPAAGAFGVTDDFFALGGHSLLAVRLLAALEPLFGRRLPVSALVTAPTIEALARLLRDAPAAARWSPLVALRAPGPGAPLFCVHPLGGNLLGYLPLVRHLPGRFAVYGLQAPGIDADTQPCASLAELAARHLDALLAVQPAPPFLLAGHSFGGLVAFEMASQLRARGLPVARLIVMDTPAPIEANRPAPVVDDGEWLLRRVRVLERFGDIDLELSADAFLALSAEAQRDRFLALMREAGLLPADAGAALVDRVLAVQRASQQAIRDYRPARYDGAIHLIRAADHASAARDADEARAFADPLLDWPALTSGPVIAATAPGDHITMLAEPQAAEVAAILHDWLA